MPKQTLYRSVSIQQLPSFISLITLQPIGNKIVEFQAGQFIEIMGPDGHALPYSIANAPCDDGHLMLYIRHLPEDKITNALIQQLTTRAAIEIMGPFGECIYQQNCAYPVLLLAAGTGMTQFKAIIEQAVHNKDPRTFHLYWGIRSEQDIFLAEQLAVWQAQLTDFRYQLVLSRSNGNANWPGKVGYVHEAVLADFAGLARFQAYLSGPWAMIDETYAQLVTKGLQRNLTYSDRFSYITT